MVEAAPLEMELLDMIVSACNVADAPERIDPDSPLIGPDSALGLDSLDAVEMVVAVQKHYGVRIGGQESSREILRSLNTLAAFIRAELGASGPPVS